MRFFAASSTSEVVIVMFPRNEGRSAFGVGVVVDDDGMTDADDGAWSIFWTALWPLLWIVVGGGLAEDEEDEDDDDPEDFVVGGGGRGVDDGFGWVFAAL